MGDVINIVPVLEKRKAEGKETWGTSILEAMKIPEQQARLNEIMRNMVDSIILPKEEN